MGSPSPVEHNHTVFDGRFRPCVLPGLLFPSSFAGMAACSHCRFPERPCSLSSWCVRRFPSDGQAFLPALLSSVPVFPRHSDGVRCSPARSWSSVPHTCPVVLAPGTSSLASVPPLPPVQLGLTESVCFSLASARHSVTFKSAFRRLVQ